MIRHKILPTTAALLLVLAAARPASAQPWQDINTKLMSFELKLSVDDPFHESNQVRPPADRPFKVFRGHTVRVTLSGNPKEAHYTYPLVKVEKEDFKPKIFYRVPAGIVPIGPYSETESKSYVDDKGVPHKKYEKPFVWSHDLLVMPETEPGIYNIAVDVDSQVCNVSVCETYKKRLRAVIEVVAEPKTDVSAALLQRMNDKLERIVAKNLDPKELFQYRIFELLFGPQVYFMDLKPTRVSPTFTGSTQDASTSGKSYAELISVSQEEYWERVVNRLPGLMVNKAKGGAGHTDDSGLLLFMLMGAAWGLISLVTPCVFPMIPITVSFFLKQSEKEHHRPITMAAIYSGTIILVLTLAAALFINFFQALIIHPLMNYAIGVLFIYFALSLFGMYEIELPSGLARFTSAREGQGGYLGVIFMALTFTIISFACVAPFLGGFAGTAASNRPFAHTLLGGLAFATTFAAPFFILALFPTMLKKMPKSGSWLNTVKVVMGFLELAAALKFLRSGELLSTSKPTFLTFDFSLGLYVALSLLCALYLLNVYRLPHDSPVDHLSVPRLLFSLVFLGLALHLLPALFKTNAEGDQQRPRGTIYAWVESFLLPELKHEEGKIGNLEYAIQKAREHRRKTGEPKRIFLDCTGVNCPNCRLNENNVFNQPEIKRAFEPYLFVTFYTDEIPLDLYSPEIRAQVEKEGRRQTDGLANLKFQIAVFNDSARPFYAVLEPRAEDDKIDIVGIYGGGVINSVNGFAEFLRNPEGKAAGQAARGDRSPLASR